MDKRTITAVLLAFMVVKTPVTLAEAKANAQPQIIEATAASEANITETIKQTATDTQILTTEDKATAEMAAYHKQLEEDAARIKAEEEARQAAEAARIAKENSDRTASLQAAGYSAAFVNQYAEAEKRFGVPWQVVAAVHMVETGMRGNTYVTSYAGAQGPMQFMPSTFAAYAVDGDNNGTMSINDVNDAIATAANYMASNGAANGQLVNALLRYNHDMGYVNHVLYIAHSLGLK